MANLKQSPSNASSNASPADQALPNQSQPQPQPQKDDALYGRAGEPSDDPPAKSKSSIAPEAYEITAEILRLMGLDSEHPFSIGAPYQVQTWLNWGWPRDAILNGVQLATQSRGGNPPGTIKYFEKAIARAHAKLTRVLPVVNLKPGQVTTGGRPRCAATVA